MKNVAKINHSIQRNKFAELNKKKAHSGKCLRSRRPLDRVIYERRIKTSIKARARGGREELSFGRGKARATFFPQKTLEPSFCPSLIYLPALLRTAGFIIVCMNSKSCVLLLLRRI